MNIIKSLNLTDKIYSLTTTGKCHYFSFFLPMDVGKL